MNSIERAIAGVLPFLAAGLPAALPLLAVSPGDDPLLASTAHLGAVVALAVGRRQPMEQPRLQS